MDTPSSATRTSIGCRDSGSYGNVGGTARIPCVTIGREKKADSEVKGNVTKGLCNYHTGIKGASNFSFSFETSRLLKKRKI